MAPVTSNYAAASGSKANSRVLVQPSASAGTTSTEPLYQTITKNEVSYTLSSNENFSSSQLGKTGDYFSILVAVGLLLAPRNLASRHEASYRGLKSQQFMTRICGVLVMASYC